MRDHASSGGIQAALEAMESDLAAVAELTREVHGPDNVTLNVTPRNPGALPIWLSYLGDEILIEAGSFGGRWQLQRTAEDVGFLIDLVEGIRAGRVRETLGPKRSRVEVTLADGTSVASTGYQSVVPRPGWRRRGQTVAYERYMAPTT